MVCQSDSNALHALRSEALNHHGWHYFSFSFPEKDAASGPPSLGLDFGLHGDWEGRAVRLQMVAKAACHGEQVWDRLNANRNGSVLKTEKDVAYFPEPGVLGVHRKTVSLVVKMVVALNRHTGYVVGRAVHSTLR